MYEAILEFFKQLSPEWAVVLVAALPISELRGAIPLGVMMGMPASKAAVLAVIGNLLPVMPILYLLEPVSARLRARGMFKVFFTWLFERTRKKASLIERYELLGLVLFVAVPLPMTGAWTGCIAASLFNLDKNRSGAAIAVGVIIAAGIVTLLTVGAQGYFS